MILDAYNNEYNYNKMKSAFRHQVGISSSSDKTSHVFITNVTSNGFLNLLVWDLYIE